MTCSSTRLSILVAAELLLLSLPATTQDVRAPIPEKDAQEEVRKLLEVLFEQEFAGKSTPEGRLMLLDKLLIQAERTNDDLTAKYVLFDEAREIAVMSGEIDRALKAVDGLGKTFRVDTVFEKKATLETLRVRARSNNLRKAVIESQIKVSIEAEAQDRYSVAHDLLTTASRSAKRLRSNELLQNIEKRLSSITVLRKEYEAVKKAETLLQANEENAQAHLTIGRFWCFLKAQWKVGLPHLAKGSDETLRDLAELDLSGGTGTQDQVTLGDGWWKEGNKAQEPQRSQLLSRARYWYEKAIPQLSGFTKVRVEKRLSEITRSAPSSLPTIAPGTTKGLVGWWKLDEGGGTAVMDSSPLKNHAATVNGPTWRQGKFGGGLFCDGVDDYVEIPNSPALENIQESSFTLSAWFLPEDAPPRGNAQTGTAYAIVAKPGMHIGLTYLAHHRFSMQYFLAPKQPQGTVGKGAIPPVARQGQYPPGSFYHVAGVVNWQSRTNRVYVNGKLEATTSWAPGPRAVEYGQKTWKIGIANPGLTNLGWRARGTIDEVRIYNRALAPTEIRVLAGTGR